MRVDVSNGISSMEQNDSRNVKGRVTTPIFLLCLLSLLSVGSASALPTIDGIVGVGAPGDAYAQMFDLSFYVEDLAGSVTGGKLFIHDTPGSITMGLLFPPTVNDNTYGTSRASDWGTDVHDLNGGGDGLEGSDKWELKPFAVNGGDDLEIKLDYITSAAGWDATVEKFKQGSNLDKSLIELDTSLADNHDNYSSFFGAGDQVSPTMDCTHLAGPPVRCVGDPAAVDPEDYKFLAPNADWEERIIYEFRMQKSAFAGDFILADFLAAAGEPGATNTMTSLGILHMSPNKLGEHKVYPFIVPPTIPPPVTAPEPGSIALFGIGLAALAMRRRRQVKK